MRSVLVISRKKRFFFVLFRQNLTYKILKLHVVLTKMFIDFTKHVFHLNKSPETRMKHIFILLPRGCISNTKDVWFNLRLNGGEERRRAPPRRPLSQGPPQPCTELYRSLRTHCTGVVMGSTSSCTNLSMSISLDIKTYGTQLRI